MEKTVSYSIKELPNNFGAVINNLNYLHNNKLDHCLIHTLKQDLNFYKILFFKNNNPISAELHREIMQAFGQIIPWGTHPKSPHPDIYRISNNPKEGFVGNGTSGFHIDGCFKKIPPKIMSFSCLKNCKEGITQFISLNTLLTSQSLLQQKNWQDLWLIHSSSAKNKHWCTPLVYIHPITNQPTMLFHTGTQYIYGWCNQNDYQKIIPAKNIANKIQFSCESLIKEKKGLSWYWSPGDFCLIDNLAVAHFAPKSVIQPSTKVGLRILHRIAIEGDDIPKHYDGSQGFMFSVS